MLDEKKAEQVEVMAEALQRVVRYWVRAAVVIILGGVVCFLIYRRAENLNKLARGDDPYNRTSEMKPYP